MAKRYKTQTEWMLPLVPAKWAVPCSPNDPDTWPTLGILQEEFVTAGSAVASRRRFGLIGRWAKKPRIIDIHVPGLKRRLNPFRPELYFGTIEKPARRCFELVETLPAANPIVNAHLVPSKPSRPKWLETGEATFVNEFGAEVDEETGQILETSLATLKGQQQCRTNGTVNSAFVRSPSSLVVWKRSKNSIRNA